jgi:hypothetical protein
MTSKEVSLIAVKMFLFDWVLNGHREGEGKNNKETHEWRRFMPIPVHVLCDNL